MTHQRLRRPCKYCGIYYIPTGKEETLCLKCFKKAILKRQSNRRIKKKLMDKELDKTRKVEK